MYIDICIYMYLYMYLYLYPYLYLYLYLFSFDKDARIARVLSLFVLTEICDGFPPGQVR